MVRIPASALARFGRGLTGAGRSLRPAVPFALRVGAVTTGIVVGAGAAGRLAGSVGEALNPSLQEVALDPDPTKPGDESTALFDRKTGQIFVFGQPSSETTTPVRSLEKGFLYAAAAVAAVAVLVLVWRRK